MVRRPNRLISRLIVLIITLFFIRFSYANSAHQPIHAATLIYPPYQYMTAGEAKGIAVELIKEAASRVGISDVEFSFYPWKRAVKSVEVGDYDLLFNAGKNEARQEWGHYVDSVLIMQKYALFKRKRETVSIDETFNNVDKLGIGIRAGYLYGSGAFRQALDQDKFAYQVFSDSTSQSVTQLLNRRIDVFVGDILPVMHYIAENNLTDDIDIILNKQNDEHIVLTWPTYILMSKKTSSLSQTQALNAAMESMKLDGTYEKIFNRYIR